MDTYAPHPSNDGYSDLSIYGHPGPGIRRIPPLLPLSLFGIVAVLMGLDVVYDATSGAMPAHVILEVLLTVLALTGAWMFFQQWRRERALLKAREESLREREEALDHAREDARHWRDEAETWRKEAEDAMRGLGFHIEQQFERWELTPAEREVALLSLKGLSHKEIAAVRDVSERTVRDQARAVYKKGGLGGRAELSAFFLEDLLLPSSTAEILSNKDNPKEIDEENERRSKTQEVS